MPRPEGDDDAAWRLARRRLFLPVSGVFVALSLTCLAGVRIPEPVQYIPFAIGMVALGLPHGALDHLVPARLAGRPTSIRTIAPVVLLYAALGALVIGLWWVAPPVAFLFFIGLTWFHWGQGDLFVSERGGARHPQPAARGVDDGGSSRRAGRVATLVLRGALPMVVPLIAFPGVYLAVAASATGIFSPGDASPTGPSWVGDVLAGLTSVEGRVGLALVFAGVAVVAGILNRPSRTRLDEGRMDASRHVAEARSWRRDAVEVLVLALFFSTVPPVLAVGLYFCLWHSLRHVVRLSLLDESLRAPLVRGQFGLVFVRFTRQAAPVTLIALAILVGLYAIVPHAGTDLGSLLGLYLVLISALTLPHVVIVSLMDRVQARQSARLRAPDTAADVYAR